MIKLNKQVEALETVIEKLETKVEELEDKKQAVLDLAFAEGREPTAAESKKMDKIDLEIEDLILEADTIRNALDYLSDYAD